MGAYCALGLRSFCARSAAAAPLIYGEKGLGPLGRLLAFGAGDYKSGGGQRNALSLHYVLGAIRFRMVTIANGDWAVSPDGRHVAFVESQDRNIWLLTLMD